MSRFWHRYYWFCLASVMACKSKCCHYLLNISMWCSFHYLAGGVGRRGVRPGGPPLTQQHRRGVRSQSQESTPPKDLDLVTKRMLSARLLKINELRNALAELQQRTDELQKENRILRQVFLTLWVWVLRPWQVDIRVRVHCCCKSSESSKESLTPTLCFLLAINC